MAHCPVCKNELPPDAAFCPHCAQPVAPRAAAAVTAVPAAAGVLAATITLSGTDTRLGPPGVPSPPDLREGDVFHDRFTIARALGAGAMGVVYLALDRVTGREVALKLINPAMAERPSVRERFVREGLMARDIRHPNVVSMFDVGDAGGQIYLVMEYLPGDSLRKWLRRSLQEGRDISFDEARGIVRAVLEGLAAAHATGVVHRDLKPENIMLTGDPHAGQYGLKILDFGIARAAGTTSHVTTTSSSTGTPLYMAPEQKTAADTVGPAADLYAVAAMLYELLIGVAPEGRWALPSRERRDLPAGIDAVIETGLANRPRSRYQSAQAFLEALDGLTRPDDRGPGAPPDTAEPPPPEPPKAPPPEPPKAPPPPPPPPAEVKKGARWDWLKARSPAWALWDRLSPKQRMVVGPILAVLFLALAAAAVYSTIPRPAVPSKVGDIGGGAGVPPQPPPPPRPADLRGRWFDELTGAGVALTYSDLGQQEDLVSGPIYNGYGYQVGTFSGKVTGDSLEYSWLAADGGTGTGRGRLRADGVHLDIETYDNRTGVRLFHVMHKNHVPPG